MINSLWAWAGGLGFSPFHGIVSTAYSVFRLKHNNKWSQIFFHYLVRSSPFQWELQTRSKGVWISRLQITDESFLDISFPLPSLSEQRAIAKFLDWADRRIRLIIAARKRRIQLLEEYRQTLIDDAVTGKFDVRTGKPYPAYKDSGEEWLGKVPEEWEVKQLKRVTRLNPSKTEVPRALRTGLATFLPMERVGNDGTFDASEIRPVKDLWNGFTYFRKGDVIVAKITPSFENGKGALLETLPTTLGFGSTEFHVLRPSKLILPKYLYLLTVHSEFRRLGADHMTGAAGQQRVPADFIANFPVPLPPLPEQRAIAEYLDRETRKIGAAIEKTKKSIELWEELRTKLIADVVTGKYDVREVAKTLPEEEPELDAKIGALEASLKENGRVAEEEEPEAEPAEEPA